MKMAVGKFAVALLMVAGALLAAGGALAQSGIPGGASEEFRQTYERAATGDAEAQTKLGSMYYNGQGGVRQDKARAKEYYGQACDNGYQKGCDKYRELNTAGW